MIVLFPALLTATSAVLLLWGWRIMRTDAVEQLDLADFVLLRKEQRKTAGSMGPMERMASRAVPGLRRLIGATWAARLQRQIDLAGRPEGVTVDAVLRRFVMWAFILSPAALLFAVGGNLFSLLATAVAVAVMPLARLATARRKRQDRIERDLPDFLDILAVTVSAGVSFRWALAHVAERYGGPLAEEIRLTLGQLASGASLRSAFESLRARNQSEALSEFVTAFLQSEELGAPLVETLNQIAIDMRRDSAQRMRRKAAQASPRVTLVTSLVLVPGALILVIVGLLLGSDVDLGSLFSGLE